MRAQTTLDFAIGVSIFLIVVVYVLAFVPGVFAPFDRAQEDQTVAVDRVASNLVEGQLAEPAEPYRLHPDCTVAFFNEVEENTNDNNTYTPDGDCRFEDRALSERLAIDEVRNVYVVLRGDVGGGGVEVLCYDADADQVVGEGDGACDTAGDDFLLETGRDAHSNSESVAVAQRIVTFRGHTVTLVVRMW